MKGSNKQFAKYLDNEYNDFYLEAPDDYDDEYDFEETYKDLPNKNPKPANQAKPQDDIKPKPQEQKKPAPKKSRQPEFKANFTLDRAPLTNVQMKKFVNLLGQDAKNCYYNLKEVQLPEPSAMDVYKQLYTKFETVPVLFLSVLPGQAVYLWQINRLCPYQKATDHMVLDSRAMNAETKLHISMLLLAKIGQSEGEELIDAKFTGPGKLMVKSMKGRDQIVIRLYKVKSFFQIARVNPFKQEVLATDEYSFKLVFTLSKLLKEDDINSGVSMISANLWKRKSTEEITAAQIANYNNNNAEGAPPVETEILLETKTLMNLPGEFAFQDSTFSEVFITNQDIITLVDKSTSTVIAWKDTFISMWNLDIGVILSAHLVTNIEKSLIYLVTVDEYKVYEINLSEFPLLPVIDRTELVNLSPYFLQGFEQEELQHIVQKSSLPYMFVRHQNYTEAITLGNQRIYSTPIGLIDYPRGTAEVVHFEKELEKAKTFSWTVIEGSTENGERSKLVYLRDHYLNFVYPFGDSNPSSIDLTFQESDKSKVWQILGVDQRVLLCGRFLNKLETTIMEVKYPFTGSYQDSQVTILNEEEQKYESFSDERLFCQVIGPNNEIAFIRFDNEPFYTDSLNMMYDVPISLINPLSGKKSKGNGQLNQEDDEEKKEEERMEKMNKIKNEVRHIKGQSALEENKAKLKEVRGEIGSKIKDIKKFDEEFKKHQTEISHPSNNNKKKEDTKVMKAPKGVSKESLELYDEIKTEKKKIEKGREKDKTQRKKDRNWKNDM